MQVSNLIMHMLLKLGHFNIIFLSFMQTSKMQHTFSFLIYSVCCRLRKQWLTEYCIYLDIAFLFYLLICEFCHSDAIIFLALISFDFINYFGWFLSDFFFIVEGFSWILFSIICLTFNYRPYIFSWIHLCRFWLLINYFGV